MTRYRLTLALLLLAGPAFGQTNVPESFPVSAGHFRWTGWMTEANLIVAETHWRWVRDNACLNTDRPEWSDYQRLCLHSVYCWKRLLWTQRLVDPECRWEAMCDLQRALGDEYWLGRMPHPIPCWEKR